MAKNRTQHGFALADLLVGLTVGAIVLAAAATMADAMSRGKRATEQISRTSNYLAQVHTRLSDLVMRAEGIETRSEGGVELTYADGRTVQLYTDDQNRIVIAENDAATSYLADPAQAGVVIAAADSNRVVVSFEIGEQGVVRRHAMTVARRGGE